MSAISKRLLIELSRTYFKAFGLRPLFFDLSERVTSSPDPLHALPKIRRMRTHALHESVNWGVPHIFTLGHSITSWIVAVEDRRIVHGGFIGGEVLTSSDPQAADRSAKSLIAMGMPGPEAEDHVRRLPRWTPPRVRDAALFLQTSFYQMSGWKPLLMEENRLKVQQQQQLAEAIEDQRRRGVSTAYPFEKERVLLSLIRAGDRRGTRQVLNEMLAAMYLASPELPVLRARMIELMGYLTRAAVEDSPLMEHMIERNLLWMRRLIEAPDFEMLSRVLTQALDDFVEGIYLHGFNRSNAKVSQALQYISEQYAKSISLADVAMHISLSPFRTAHLVKKHTGKTVIQIIHQVRAHAAQHLLEQSSKSCTEIAYEVGYGDQSYFIKHFKRVSGVTPAQYRRAHFAAPQEA